MVSGSHTHSVTFIEHTQTLWLALLLTDSATLLGQQVLLQLVLESVSCQAPHL